VTGTNTHHHDSHHENLAMFGNANKIKLDPALIARCKQIAEKAGYASHEEFIVHIIEKELAQFEGADSDAAITEKLKGLGYIS